MKKILLFIFCFVFWLLITWELDVQSLCAGAVISFMVALVFGDMSRAPGRHLARRFPQVVLFLIKVWCLWVKSSVMQLYFIAGFRSPEEKIEEMKLSLTDQKAVALLVWAANFLPGVIIISEHDGVIKMEVTWRDAVSVKSEIEKLENMLKKVFI